MSELKQDRFEEPTLIGEGGMGQVFQVQDPRLDRTVAVKLLHKERLDEGKTAARFLAEAKTTGALEHPSIPPVYELGETEDGLPYFALKLLQGETLEDVISRLRDNCETTHQHYDFAERVRIALRLCDALIYAHDHGVLHRDIKPDNIMLGPFGEVWLVDWGVAGPPNTSEEPEKDGKASERLTEESTFMGTMGFAAPEAIAGVCSQASDQFSLGAVLYEFFTTEPAHPGETRMEIMSSVISERPKSPELFKKERQGRVPRETSVLLLKMLEKEADQRFRDLKEVQEEFKTIAGGDIRAICPHTLTKKSLHRVGRILDNHNYWLMPLLILWLLYPLYALVDFLSGYLFRA